MKFRYTVNKEALDDVFFDFEVEDHIWEEGFSPSQREHVILQNKNKALKFFQDKLTDKLNLDVVEEEGPDEEEVSDGT